MPEHPVKAFVQNLDVSRAGSGITLEAYSTEADGTTKLLGTIEIGQGSFGWRPPYQTNFKRIPWTQFANIMGRIYDGEEK